MKLYLTFVFLVISTLSLIAGNPNSLNTTFDGGKDVQLRLNNDQTFTYLDKSNPERKIMVSGTYLLKGNTVELNGDLEDRYYHSKWKLKNDRTVATSRKVLSFYRLVIK